MDFFADGLPITPAGLEYARTTLDVDLAAIWAILDVETGGFGYLPDRCPKVLFERHVFHYVTKGRYDATHPDISNPTPGGYIGGAGEYARILEAVDLDYESALDSASWGIGQILGFNSDRVGYDVVDDLVADMIHGEDAQLRAMATFIASAGLAPALRNREWDAFAAGYNGAGYYAERLAAANARFRASLPDLTVRTAQAALCYLGFQPGPVDGIAGPRTSAAIAAYQVSADLPVTAKLDARTEDALLVAAFPE